MIDDIIEGGIKAILISIARFLFRLVVEILLFYTGEIVVFILTLGWKKPRWDSYVNERPIKFYILTDVSTIIGLIFWLAVFGIIGQIRSI